MEDEKNAEIVNFFVRSAFFSFLRCRCFFLRFPTKKKIALLWIYSYGKNANVFVSESIFRISQPLTGGRGGGPGMRNDMKSRWQKKKTSYEVLLLELASFSTSACWCLKWECGKFSWANCFVSALVTWIRLRLGGRNKVSLTVSWHRNFLHMQNFYIKTTLNSRLNWTLWEITNSSNYSNTWCVKFSLSSSHTPTN